MGASKIFPWGERDPAGGFRVGDCVGLIYSDHERYVFDNPVGIVRAVEPAEDEDDLTFVTVLVEAKIGSDSVFLIERDGESYAYQREEVNG